MRNETIDRTYVGGNRDAPSRSRLASGRARRLALRRTQQGAGLLWAALQRSGDGWNWDEAPPGVEITDASCSERDYLLQIAFAIIYYALLVAIVIWAFLRQ